ncbi:uncharacterized protein LOC126846702 [Adelges cooleyi]|uniref:uncharacterized protein LOC126846702 n=1 Tax=Adelges cooleyi TaxID=133065 RepID=UPI00218053A2|nr:uncharacterized protein LOC126846702 [Adelges cooleyi]
MYLKYTILLISNFLIAIHILGAPSGLNPELTEEKVGASLSSVPARTGDNVVASPGSVPARTTGNVGASSSSAQEDPEEEILCLSFDDCRLYAKKKAKAKYVKQYVSLDDFLEYVGDTDIAVEGTILYLNGSQIGAAKKNKIGLSLYKKLVRAYCHPPGIPIAEFVRIRRESWTPNSDPDL